MSTLKLLSAYSHITNTVLRFNENKKLILVLSVQSEQTGAPTEWWHSTVRSGSEVKSTKCYLLCAQYIKIWLELSLALHPLQH